jgi:hypothetical protein
VPSIIASTTALQLEAALIGLIAQIEPTHEASRSHGWTPTDGNREVGESSECARLFYVQHMPGGVVPGGLTGNGDTETELGFDILADYRFLSSEERGTVVEMDQWDIHDALHDAINVVPGLTHVEVAGEPQPDGDEEAARYRLPFTLFYMRAR